MHAICMQLPRDDIGRTIGFIASHIYYSVGQTLTGELLADQVFRKPCPLQYPITLMQPCRLSPLCLELKSGCTEQKLGAQAKKGGAQAP